MNERVVLLKIAVVFLVLLIGWLARRRGYLAGDTVGVLSRFLVDVTFPCLVFSQMLATVDSQALREGWYLPLLCFGALALGAPVGALVAPAFTAEPGPQRRTFPFLVAFANYIYLPLPIVEALYGDAGVRAILLCNVGGQLALWSLGVWLLQGGLSPRESLKQIANPGMIATGLGIVTALLIPASRTLGSVDPTHAGPVLMAAGAAVQAMALLGTLVIPLSLLVIGAQLGGLAVQVHRPSRAVVGVLITRLLLTPLAALLLLKLLAAAVSLPPMALVVTFLIATMPIGLSTSLFAERFDGDIELSAQSIFLSTLLSLVTVPTWFWVAGVVGL